MTEFFNNLAAAADVFVGLFVLALTLFGLIPGFRERLFRWFPSISIHFKSPEKSGQNEFKQLRPLSDPANSAGWFYRLGVRNSGMVSLNDADVQLVRIERFFNGQRYPLAIFSPIELHWANAQGDFSRTIFPDDVITDFVDVVHTVKGQESLIVFAKEKHRSAGNNFLLPKGQYYFHLRVTGKTSLPSRPLKAILYLDWSGDWEALEFQIVRDFSSHRPTHKDYSSGDHWVEHAGSMHLGSSIHSREGT